MALLDLRGLHVDFPGPNGPVPVLRDLDWSVEEGESVALVGESGSGKTLLALACLGLLPRTAQVRWRSFELGTGQDRRVVRQRQDLAAARGRCCAMVFQEPGSALHPTLSVGRQLEETLVEVQGLSARDARRRATELLERVGIPEAPARRDDPPFRFSGGMQQRVGIALALACRPQLLVADEPTTALDMTTQAAIVSLLAELRDEKGLALWWITHDLELAGAVAERLEVLLDGRRVESGAAGRLLQEPRHPYTAGLLASAPRTLGILPTAIPPPVASASHSPDGCPFQGRCPEEDGDCDRFPATAVSGSGGWVACHHPLTGGAA